MSTAFRISLDGAQQVPVVVSSATGLGVAIFDSATSSMSFSVNVQGLDWGLLLGQASQTGTTADDINGVHIHNAARGVNGGIVLDWPGGGDADDFSVSGVMFDGSRTLTSVWETTDVNPISGFVVTLAGATLGADVPLYMNIHTTANGGGEIRGQLVCIATDNGEVIAGTAGNDTMPGLGGDDTISGGVGNDSIDGGTGADMMFGGIGNDTYFVDNVGDVVTENASEGSDLVKSTITYTLGANVEDLTLLGGAIDGTGNGLANFLFGSSGNNVLTGLGGDDELFGAGGTDTLIGGTGNDSYFSVNGSDTLVENPGEGTDSVTAEISYTLPTDFENLTLILLADFNGTGNAADNIIIGNPGTNVLTGLGGNDTLDGDVGADTLIGGTGNDTYMVDSNFEVITENPGEGTDTVISTVSYVLPTNVENLTLQTFLPNTFGYGNALDNTIIGDFYDNVINGLAGADTMVGGLGNDVFYVDNNFDVITETAGQGTDTVYSTQSFQLGGNVEFLFLQGSGSINGFGDAVTNYIEGNSGDNGLNGGAGTDALVGRGGNDLYFVDNAGDVVTEAAGEGNDTVFSTVTYTLSAEVESLVLQGSANINGTGNALANLIQGNTGNNVLDGGVGADTMIGGTGNDNYVVDSGFDAITENSGEGNDTVFTAVTYVLPGNVENLVMQGAGGTAGYGNTLANVITGTAGVDTIDGLTGADTMFGYAGNDVFTVDNNFDVINEAVGEGTDTVYATVSFQLGGNVEFLFLQGAGNINGFGDSATNYIEGNSGDNGINGGGGTDALYGMGGNDLFIFNAGEANGDILYDFAGNGAGLGDLMQFVGYGIGATFTNIDATHWQVNYNGGSSHDIITFDNGAAVDPTDFFFT